MKSEDIEIIYWASPNCGYCEMFTPTVKEVSYENKLTFNYLNDNYRSFDKLSYLQNQQHLQYNQLTKPI